MRRSPCPTPTYRQFNATATIARNEVPVFAEGSEGRELRATAGLTMRPTKSIRSEATMTLSQIERDFDGSEYARTVDPRLKVEYQPTRASVLPGREPVSGAANDRTQDADGGIRSSHPAARL